MPTFNRDYGLLHPKMSPRVADADKLLLRAFETGKCEFLFKVFEGYRDVVGQRDRLVSKVTKAAPWQSAHQYGLAVDYVPYLTTDQARKRGVKAGWFWPVITDESWIILHQVAADAGLINTIPWDRPHCEHPMFEDFYDIMQRY